MCYFADSTLIFFSFLIFLPYIHYKTSNILYTKRLILGSPIKLKLTVQTQEKQALNTALN